MHRHANDGDFTSYTNGYKGAIHCYADEDECAVDTHRDEHGAASYGYANPYSQHFGVPYCHDDADA